MYGIELPGVASNFDFVRKHDALRILHNFFYILSICINVLYTSIGAIKIKFFS